MVSKQSSSYSPSPRKQVLRNGKYPERQAEGKFSATHRCARINIVHYYRIRWTSSRFFLPPLQKRTDSGSHLQSWRGSGTKHTQSVWKSGLCFSWLESRLFSLTLCVENLFFMAISCGSPTLNKKSKFVKKRLRYQVNLYGCSH